MSHTRKKRARGKGKQDRVSRAKKMALKRKTAKRSAPKRRKSREYDEPRKPIRRRRREREYDDWLYDGYEIEVTVDLSYDER